MRKAAAIDKPGSAGRDDRLPVVVIAGPTASGKSALALDLAAAFDAVIINADSMQIYRDLPILTAQPGPAALAVASHRLYGILALDDPATAMRWAGLAAAEIAAARERERLPILVGGTGLYLRALLQGFAPIPDIDPAYRAAAKTMLAELGPAGLHARLAARDPETAAQLRPSDSQRIMRAWEVLAATGKPLAWWQVQATTTPAPVQALSLVVSPARSDLYAACDDRFIAMVARGAVAEVAAARAAYPGADGEQAGFRALGFRELAEHLDGRLPIEAAVAAAQRATRNYAKRQTTWFRHQLPEAIFLTPDREAMKFSQSSIASMGHKIRDFLLTHQG